MIKKILKRVTPHFLKNFYGKLWRFIYLHSLKKKGKAVVQYIKHIPKNKLTQEQKEIVEYFECNPKLEYPWSMYPYSYTKKYRQQSIAVHIDNTNGMRYVMHEGKRLYYKRSYKEEDVIASYRFFRMEQSEINSPHRYETPEFHVSVGDVVVDAGVAEGNFGLQVVERAKELYLFEPDKEWIEPLQVTFAPWKNKVYIINNYISDIYDGGGVNLDNFFKNKKIDFIKADIEGYEPKLLAGAKAILSRQASMKIVLCTYHKNSDATECNEILLKNGFRTEFSKGYMIFVYDTATGIAPSSYLRKCLIRGEKKNK
jgi:hypothetical protein